VAWCHVLPLLDCLILGYKGTRFVRNVWPNDTASHHVIIHLEGTETKKICHTSLASPVCEPDISRVWSLASPVCEPDISRVWSKRVAVTSYCLIQRQLINAVNEEVLIDLQTRKNKYRPWSHKMALHLKAKVSLLKSQNTLVPKGWIISPEVTKCTCT